MKTKQAIDLLNRYGYEVYKDNITHRDDIEPVHGFEYYTNDARGCYSWLNLNITGSMQEMYDSPISIFGPSNHFRPKSNWLDTIEDLQESLDFTEARYISRVQDQLKQHA